MKKTIYLNLFYFFIIFSLSTKLVFPEEYRKLDRVIAIVEKEVITEIELQNSIKQVKNYSEEQGNKEQYEELIRANVLN